ncbi:helix-turn-helix domain-containing protein [Streptomyces sp. NPDC001435]|uniref:helix-turn-helix domain-containing protein n=1 Tax=Streptomyces sp. NPDC001435 TaxID=3364576 RepID=UPI00367F5C08
MTLARLEALLKERGMNRSQLLNPGELAAKTALSERTVSVLLQGGRIPADTVTTRVSARIKALADAYLARTGKRMADLAGSISRELGVSSVWARQVCSGDKVPSVELLHGLVGFFGVEGGEAFFTAPASEALNRALLPMLAALQQTPVRPQVEDLAALLAGHEEAVPSPRDADADNVLSREQPTSAALVLSARLNRLFEVMHPKGREAYTSHEAAEIITAHGGKITAMQIEQLRNGTWNPQSEEPFEPLANFFGVPVSYFVDDEVASQVSADLNLVDTLKAQGIGPRQIALRAVADLDEDALAALVPVIQHLHGATKRQRM